MGFLDRVKEMASEGLEKGQELAKTQQAKMELKKLEAQVDDAYAAYGRKAYQAAAAGTLSTAALTAETQAVKDAEAAVDAKKQEIDAIRDEEEKPAAPA
jgi:hypothetical protein